MKVFQAVINNDEEELGLDAIALVENPAVEVDFLKFSKENSSVKLKFDSEKHIISGPALLADVPIYRYSQKLGEFYIVFTKETIRQLVEKYSKLNLNNSVNIEHNDNDFVSDVTMIESYIKDEKRGINPVEFKDVTDGSWLVSFKVNNPEVWNKIKSGEVKGFSIQGLFDLTPFEDDFDSFVNDLV